MNVAGSMARERGEIEPREIERDGFIVPQTARAETKEAVGKRGEEDEEQPKAGGEFQCEIRLFGRLGLEHHLLGERQEERAKFFQSNGENHAWELLEVNNAAQHQGEIEIAKAQVFFFGKF